MLPEGGVYIAGPMRGQPDCGFPPFFAAESWLLANTAFWPIFNPARRDVEATGVEFRGVTEFGEDFDLADAMQADLDFIATDDCACLVVLPGWEGSEGTLAEMSLAKQLGKPIFYIHDTPHGHYIWPRPR